MANLKDLYKKLHQASENMRLGLEQEYPIEQEVWFDIQHDQKNQSHGNVIGWDRNGYVIVRMSKRQTVKRVLFTKFYGCY